jgi:sterol desaturase/sphingolipid hydroxylase (fatty acid hydroxylase superfamily)
MEALVPVFIVVSILALLERVLPGQRYPEMRGWRTKGLVYFGLYLSVGVASPWLWDGWLGEHRLLDGTRLSTPIAALVGLLAIDLATYWWHRALHRSDFLFRVLHQTHHSVERVDLASAFVFHPLDLLAFAFVGSFSLVFVLGLSGEAAGLANLAFLMISNFQHTNIRTPHWLAYLVLRPENHAYHHQRGIHGFNYGGLAVWDMLFGTFRNPRSFTPEPGFYLGASRRTLDLLLGQDISGDATAVPTQAAPRQKSKVARRSEHTPSISAEQTPS